MEEHLDPEHEIFVVFGITLCFGEGRGLFLFLLKKGNLTLEG